MANIKEKDLPVASEIASTDYLRMVDASGASKKILESALLATIIQSIKTPLKVSYYGTTMTRTVGSNAQIVAPTVSGYTFLVWLNVATSGWIGAVEIEDPRNSTTRVWAASMSTAPGTQGNIMAFALYIRSDLA